ncbi:MAG: FAD-dependent oxidoreductase [Steroidobacteraceae bacterium]
MAGISRRSVLGGAALATLGAGAARGSTATAAGRRRRAPPPRDARADVIVIGAGLSGLASALTLEESGADVQVIEARDRVGGRMYTLFDLPGFPEVGGNSFAAGYGRVLDMAKRMGLEIAEYGARRARFPKLELVIDGKLLQPKEWAASPANRLPAALRERLPWELPRLAMGERNPLDAPEDWRRPEFRVYDVSLHDFLAQRRVPEEVIRLAYSVNPYFGTSAHDVSALMQCFNESWVASQVRLSQAQYSIRNGNQRLPMAMAARLKRPVDLGREVVAISTGSDGIVVHCADGSRYAGQRAICSLPYSVVRTIRFDPVLQGPQAIAVATLPYMINTLVFLTPKKRFWEADGLSPSMWTDGPLGTVTAQRFAADEQEVTSLVVNPRGHGAAWLDRLPREEAVRRVIAGIEAIRPAARGALELGAYHSWAQDPFAAGDWAIYAPGQLSRFGDALAQPHDRVHFCGEHTAIGNRGMEGAMESAERVSIEVLGAL